jgi:hypothetical protein
MGAVIILGKTVVDKMDTTDVVKVSEEVVMD